MDNIRFLVRTAQASEFNTVGELMVLVYSNLEGFPNKLEQPEYYQTLQNIGNFSKKENTELLVAVSKTGIIGGALLYFSDMKNYGSGGIAPQIKKASAFRLLAVHPNFRGRGLAKLLIDKCIAKAKTNRHSQLIIHSTESMKVARQIYTKIGFRRYEDIDFYQKKLPVFGFRLLLNDH